MGEGERAGVSSYRVITRHIFRRTANGEKQHIERRQTAAKRGDIEAQIELRELGIPSAAKLRISPRRWKGYWRVEMAL